MLVGCDFSSSPDKYKAITIACGSLHDGVVQLRTLERLHSLDAFSRWLGQHRSWVGGFDFPFGLPRELVQTLGWPTEWLACLRHFSSFSRPQIRQQFADFCAARPVGSKFAHRATDRPAGSSPSMKWVNRPVAYMLHAGLPLLVGAGVHLPGLYPGDSRDRAATGRPDRIALEAYPGLLAREVLGRTSYKSDDKRKQNLARMQARKLLVEGLQQGATRLDLCLELTRRQHATLIEDGSGDSLDAVLCLVQAAWAARRGWPDFGLPETMDPLEGWIVTALPEEPATPAR